MYVILVTGANGQVGRELREIAPLFPQFKFKFTTRKELDISSEEAIAAFFDENKLNYCINCAAYTAVDKAESEQEQAHQINTKAPVLLAKMCKAQGAGFLHFSTDYVYHGSSNAPLKETDKTLAQSVYAKTKLTGDEAALAENGDSIILRTSWVYSAFGHNFVKTMLRLGVKLDALKVVFDQIGTPTYAADLAAAVMEMILQLEKGKKAGGIYHYSNEGVTSWYDFALAIFELERIDCQVSPIESKDYPTPAPRPTFSVLNKAKIKDEFGLKIPHWRESLNVCLQKLKKAPNN